MDLMAMMMSGGSCMMMLGMMMLGMCLHALYKRELSMGYMKGMLSEAGLAKLCMAGIVMLALPSMPLLACMLCGMMADRYCK